MEPTIIRFENKIDLALSKLDDVRKDNLALRSDQAVVGFGLALLIVVLFQEFLLP